jgi:hypothetical protein
VHRAVADEYERRPRHFASQRPGSRRGETQAHLQRAPDQGDLALHSPVAELFRIHKNAVLRWLKDGLQANKDQRPFLIRGEELIRFLNARQTRKGCKCTPTEFYCFKCRAPRQPYLGIVDIAIESPTRLRVKSLCATCSTPINKMQNARDLPKIQNRFHVQQLTGERILDRTPASLNSDLGT